MNGHLHFHTELLMLNLKRVIKMRKMRRMHYLVHQGAGSNGYHNGDGDGMGDNYDYGQGEGWMHQYREGNGICGGSHPDSGTDNGSATDPDEVPTC